MDIKGKTVLVTGANRGIGRALVNEALRRGASCVYAASRTPFRFDDERVRSLTLDVTSEEQIARAAREVQSLDVLINNAGVASYAPTLTRGSVESHMSVNVLGPLLVSLAFLPHLKRSRGAIVNQASLAALAPVPVLSAYSMAKAALLNMTLSLRVLLAPDGISMHAVLMGPVDTDMNRDLPIDKASPEAVAALIFDGLKAGEEEIFPDPVSSSVRQGWAAGVAKALEQQFKAFAPGAAA